MMTTMVVAAKKNAFQFTNNLTKSTTHKHTHTYLIHLLIMYTLSRLQYTRSGHARTAFGHIVWTSTSFPTPNHLPFLSLSLRFIHNTANSFIQFSEMLLVVLLFFLIKSHEKSHIICSFRSIQCTIITEKYERKNGQKSRKMQLIPFVNPFFSPSRSWNIFWITCNIIYKSYRNVYVFKNDGRNSIDPNFQVYRPN